MACVLVINNRNYILPQVLVLLKGETTEKTEPVLFMPTIRTGCWRTVYIDYFTLFFLSIVLNYVASVEY